MKVLSLKGKWEERDRRILGNVKENKDIVK